MLKAALVIALLVGAMFAAKETTILARAGLLSSCSAVQGQESGETALQACRPGKLDGRPDLSRKSCSSRGIVGELEYWACPAAVVGGFKL